MAFFDDLKNRWQRLAPRERRFFQALGLTAVLCVFGFVGLQISDGLHALETRNAEVREALQTIVKQRDAYEQSRTSGALAQIGDQAPPLATYLDQIAQETGFSIVESSERPPAPKGQFQERSIDLKLRGVTIQQLADFLQKVETRSQTIVTQRIFVSTYFGQHEKLDVELTVATYERAKKETKAREGEGEGGSEGGEAGGASEEAGG